MAQQMSESFHKFEDKLGTVADQAAEALKAAEQKGEESFAVAKGKVKERWGATKADLDKLRHSAKDYSQSAAKATDHFVHDRPWTTAGIAAGIGLLVGWLITRD